MIDLAGLAEDALTMPAPVAPGERVGTRSGVGDVHADVVAPDTSRGNLGKDGTGAAADLEHLFDAARAQ